MYKLLADEGINFWAIQSPQGGIIYDWLPESDLRVICKLLNNGIGPEFDAIEADPEWQAHISTQQAHQANAPSPLLIQAGSGALE